MVRKLNHYKYLFDQHFEISLSLGKPEYKGAGDVLSKVVKNEVS